MLGKTWVDDFYDDLMADILLDRVPATEELDGIVRLLDVSPGDLILDQGCGIGSMALPLADRGYLVEGVDLSVGYIERAQNASAKRGLSQWTRFTAADACRFHPRRLADGAISWFTSWGHGGDDVTNQAMLSAAAKALKPGARFLLDTMNVPYLLANFRAQDRTMRFSHQLGAEVELIRESRLDLDGSVLEKRWRIRVPGQEAREYRSAMRLYSPLQIEEMLRAAGFCRVRFSDGIGGNPATDRTPRLLAVAERPGRDS